MSESRIEEVFGVTRVLLPVVHPIARPEAMASVRASVDAGCKGIFLINQGMSADEVLELVMIARAENPHLWVGVNLLGHRPAQVLRRGLEVCDGRLDGIWTDDAGIDAEGCGEKAVEFRTTRHELGWRGLYFGGVAFKYQQPVPAERLGDVAREASAYMDVVCTSGPGTGSPAEVSKVIAMRAGMGPGPALALASGITEANVHKYLPHVDAYLVGTGIERELGVLDPELTARLQAKIAGGDPAA